jgi:hypothetical protein
MPESREEYMLLQTIQPVETGEVLQKIPPHMTVLSWFSINQAFVGELHPLLDTLVEQYDVAHAIGGERVLFGANEDMPACKIVSNVQEVHDEVMHWVDAKHGTFRYEDYARNLQTHITDEQGVSVQTGEHITFATLALFAVQNADIKRIKRVEYAIALEGTHETTA